MTIFWVDDEGKLLKATSDNAAPIGGATGVKIPPESGRQLWDSEAQEWGPVPPPRPSRERAIDAMLRRTARQQGASKEEKDYVVTLDQ